MSEEYAKRLGLKIGEKVIWPHYTPYIVDMQVVTVKDVRPLYGEESESELVLDVEEFEEYINPLSVYTKEQILALFDGD